jgi:acetyl esterase
MKLHPQVEASLAVRRRPPADVLAAEPLAQVRFARAAMEESNSAECGPALPLPVVVDVDADGVPCRLATVAARRQRDAATPLDHQVLIYPMIDPMTASESYEEVGGYGLDRESVRLAWEAFVPDVALRYTPDLAPLAVADLSGMPSTLLITAEYDVLRDEGADYADALIAAGVPVVHVRYAGVNHGFARKLVLFDAARAAVDQVATSLRAALTF